MIFPSSGEALFRLQQAGYLLFIVTNQSGVGRGYFNLEDVDRVHEHLLSELEPAGVRFTKIYIAPEAPDRPSRGRKPSPQFLWEARDEFQIDLGASYIIGDKLIDLECGWNAGVRRSFLVRTGYGAKLEKSSPAALARAVIVNGLPQAADMILNDDRNPIPSLLT